MKAVNVTTQAQAKCVIEAIGSKVNIYDWNFYKELTCLNLNGSGYAKKEAYLDCNYIILTFKEWLLEHCKEKYKGNPIVRCLNTHEDVFQIDSDTIHKDNGIWAYKLKIQDDYMMLYNTETMQFAEIITEAQPEQREIVGYAAPIPLWGGEVNAGTIYKKIGNISLYGRCVNNEVTTRNILPAELVEAYFTTIYKKTEAEEQAEMWDELHDDFINNDHFVDEYSFNKQQTKFKLVRNEN